MIDWLIDWWMDGWIGGRLIGNAATQYCQWAVPTKSQCLVSVWRCDRPRRPRVDHSVTECIHSTGCCFQCFGCVIFPYYRSCTSVTQTASSHRGLRTGAKSAICSTWISKTLYAGRKAGIPLDRHRHGKVGLPRRALKSACPATSPLTLPRAGHARRSSPTCPPTCPTRALFLARMSVRDARKRVNVYFNRRRCGKYWQPGRLLKVTCGLTACSTPGSAPGPSLVNEYGRTLSYFLAVLKWSW